MPAIPHQIRVAIIPDQPQQADLFNMIQIQLKPEDTLYHGPYFHEVEWGEKVKLALGTNYARAGIVYQTHIFSLDIWSIMEGRVPSETSLL